MGTMIRTEPIEDDARVIGRTREQWLTGWQSFEDGASSIRALFFGTLANLAWPIVEHYRSDLFHDARWIADYVNGPMVLYFACDEWGTAIGTDAALIAAYRSNAWRVELIADTREHSTGAAWYVHLTPIASTK